MFLSSLAGFLAANTAPAQPVIAANGVVNSASYHAPGLPGSGIAQGSIFVILGNGLGPATLTPAPGVFPLPITLAGTSVTISSGGIETPAILLYTSEHQIGAIVPSTVHTGTAKVTVTFNGQTSAQSSIQVVTNSFGIYTFNQGGFGQAIASDIASRQHSIIHTFHPGDHVILWGTGIGPTSVIDAGPPHVGNIGNVQVFVGNTSATVGYHGRSGCCSGVDQIVFEVPSGVEGCYVPVAVQAGGTLSNVTTIAVSGSGNTCSDSILGSDLVSKLASGETINFGYIRLEEGLGGDFGFGTFSQFTPATAGIAEYGVSPGYCTACQGRANLPCVLQISDFSPGTQNAGTQITVDGFGRTVPIPDLAGGFYFAVLNPPDGSRYLWTGLSYVVAGTGGSQIGKFSATDKLNSNAALISFPGQGATVPLNQDLNVQWSGGSGKGILTIGGISYADSAQTQYAAFQCSADASQNQFTIPGWVLSDMPPARSRRTARNSFR